MPEKTSAEKITEVYKSMNMVSLEKNRRYGDSALNGAKIFSKLDATPSICIRLDDKLSRVKNSETLRKNDISDIMGYLVLLSVSEGWLDFSDQID